MDKYANYKYYKGEEETSYSNFKGKGIWWRIEKYAFDKNDDKEKGYLSITMLNYIRNKHWESDSGMPTTTWEECVRRATWMYRNGLWSSAYLSDKDAKKEICY